MSKSSTRRQDTCPGTPCPFWKRYAEFCPFFVSGVWASHDDGERYETKDCSPKRTMILSQQIYDRMEGVQKSHDNVREANHMVLKHMLDIKPLLPRDMDALEADYQEVKQKQIEE